MSKTTDENERLGKAQQGLGDSDFANHLKSIFKDKKDLAMGALHMVGLSKAQKKFGKQWPKVKDRVHETVRTILRERMAATDVFAPVSDTSYIICFAELDKTQAQIKGALIAEEIAVRIFGEEDAVNVIRLDTASIDISGEFIFEQTSKEALLQQVTASETDTPIVHEVGTSPDSFLGDNLCDFPKAAQTENAVSSESRAGAQEELEIQQGLWFVYRPAWLVKRQVIAAHTCIPVAIGHDGFLLYGGEALFAKFSKEFFNLTEAKRVNQDIAAFQEVVNDLTVMERLKYSSSAVVVPVHIETVTNFRRREKYLDILRNTPKTICQNILFELMNVSEQTPNTLLREVFWSLKPYCRAVIIRFRLEIPSFDNLEGLPLHAVGVDIGNIPMNNAELIRNMNLFVKRASNRKLRTFIHGVKEASMLKASVSCGFFYIDGSMISSPVEMPRERRPLKISDILKAPVLTSLD